MLEPWLILKQWVFSAWKTSESIRSLKKFDPLQQINITNQPTGYTHILIKSWDDLVNLLKDIYEYNLYITWYEEKLEYYELLKDTLEAYNSQNLFDYFSNAKNILITSNYWTNFWIKRKIAMWLIQTCNLEKWQIEKEIKLMDKYFEQRKVLTDKYWEDLIPWFFNCMVLDELHLYFWTRNFKENFKGENAFLMDFVAFPVKLNTRIEWIAQNVNALDIVFRRQCSLYITHETTFFWLVKTTNTFNVIDPEHPTFDEHSLVSKTRTFNWYKVIWYPKLQYYRNHIIMANKDDSIYERGDYFKYIANITKNINELEEPETPLELPLETKNLEAEKKYDKLETANLNPVKPKWFNVNDLLIKK